MPSSALSHVIAFDDFPFLRAHRGDVPVVGAIFAGLRLEGVVRGRVRRDGANATRNLAELVERSKFAPQLQLVMLQGIALGGFNVVDIAALHARLSLPVLVVARRAPRLDKIRRALLTRVPGGARKWSLIERLGAMEPVAGVFVQRAGVSLHDAARVIRRLAVHSRIPEPLRTAHLIAGGIATGQSRGRP
jgi:endonuclease V-like protein UPF0215 family